MDLVLFFLGPWEGKGAKASFIGLVTVFYLDANLPTRPNQFVSSKASKSVVAKTMVRHPKAIILVETISHIIGGSLAQLCCGGLPLIHC